jgi:hypothetical protein
MTKLIFAFMQAHGGDERESLLLAHSLREFGGVLANQPLWLMMPNGQAPLSESIHQKLGELGVQFYRFEVPEEALNFPYGCKVYAAAAADELASTETDVLVWMDSDTVFTGQPSEFVLRENTKLGYRPVMLKNISSLYHEPVNTFWDFIFKGCDTPVDDMPMMLTTVDAVRIRPQYNAGILSVRPNLGLLQAWRDNFERLYNQPDLLPFYQEHVLYRIFVHQAILSATLLAKLKKREMDDLGTRYNQPTFLDIDPAVIREAITLRYDEFKYFDGSDWERQLDLKFHVKAWLSAKVGR